MCIRDRSRLLDEGSIVVASMLPGDFTTSGHFILIYGSNLLGFKVYDPNSIEPVSYTHLLAPSPLYTSFEEVWELVRRLKEIMDTRAFEKYSDKAGTVA